MAINKSTKWLFAHFTEIYGLLIKNSSPINVKSFYVLLNELFETVSNNSGILNIGYAENPESANLLEAQYGLVRLTTETLPRSGQWLDVGCGVGGPACLVAQENPAISVTGVNITPHHLSLAENRAKQDNLQSRTAFVYGNAMDIPFPDNHFDGVYAIETAFHYPNKALFAKEAYRTLKVGGRFAVADIVLAPENFEFLDRVRAIIGKKILAITEMYTAPQWRQSLINARFNDVAIQDITRQSFGLLNLWAFQIRQNRSSLLERYPRFILDLFMKSLLYYHRRVEKSPLKYILATATK